MKDHDWRKGRGFFSLNRPHEQYSEHGSGLTINGVSDIIIEC